MSELSYDKHYETLMAVVTHLAVNKWALRQPQGIAKDLSIDVNSVRIVLKTFKSLFRESSKSSEDHSDHFYSLHLRHARQSIDEQTKEERAPLDAQYFFPLLDFISTRSIQESQRSSAQKAAIIAAAVSLATSVIALIAVLLAKKTF
jgi:hypothetical protein